MGFELQSRSWKNSASLRATLKLCASLLIAPSLCLLGGCCCVGHDQLRLPDPSPCHVQCDFTQVALLDPECHGYHPTCWSPWSANCCACPPPISGVYPIIEEAPHLEVVPKPAAQQNSTPATAAPSSSQLSPPAPMPDASSHPPGVEPPPPSDAPAGTGEPKPTPADTMPMPENTPSPPLDTAPPQPMLPPLVPPGRQIPGSPADPKRKHADQELQPNGAAPSDGFEEQSKSFEMPDPLYEHTNDNGRRPNLDMRSLVAQAMQPEIASQAAVDESAPIAGESTAAASPDLADAGSSTAPQVVPMGMISSDGIPWFKKAGGVFIVGCSLLCSAVWVSRMLGAAEDQTG